MHVIVSDTLFCYPEVYVICGVIVMDSLKFFVPRAGKIHVDEVDNEHEEVVEALDLVCLHIDNAEFETVSKTREVGNLLLSHFKSEERLMKSFEYPHLNQHTVHHDQSLGSVYRILGNCEMHRRVDIEELRDLFRILIDDIFSADMAFSSYLMTQKKI